jgi:hypothetical protein
MQAIAVNLARTFPTVVAMAMEGDREAQLDRLMTVTLGDWARVSERDAEHTELILGSYLGWIVSAYTVTGYSRGEDGRVRWSGQPADDFAGLIGTALPGGEWKRGQARPLRKVKVSQAPGNADGAAKNVLVEMLRYNHDPERRRLVEELEAKISVRVQPPDTVMVRVPAGMKVLISPT